MIFNADYESFQSKRNWVQLGSIGRLRHYGSVCDMSRSVEKCQEMSSFAKVAVGGDLLLTLLFFVSLVLKVVIGGWVSTTIKNI